MKRSWAVALTSAAVVFVSSSSSAQRGGFGRYFGCADLPAHAVPYDGRFRFARLKYTGSDGNCYYRGEPSWAHGYGYTDHGTAESNLLRIAASVSVFHPRVDDTAVLAIDDPALFGYPVAYLVEAGYLTLNDKEVAALRKYLLKGGFLIIDDSREDANRGKTGWASMTSALARVLPGLRPVELTPSHPIFHSFFDIPSFDVIHQYYDRGAPYFGAIFDKNDPSKRMMVLINFNTDISQYWEYSAEGFRPVNESNEAYKLGVNYLIYALTH